MTKDQLERSLTELSAKLEVIAERAIPALEAMAGALCTVADYCTSEVEAEQEQAVDPYRTLDGD